MKHPMFRLACTRTRLRVPAVFLFLFLQAAFTLPADLFTLTNDGAIVRADLETGAAERLTPPETFVVDFGVDAAGERIAFRTETGLYLLLTSAAASEPVLLDPAAGLPAFRGRGDTVAWSPDGQVIAYTGLTGARAFLEDGAGGRFASIADGIFTSLSWSPGGSYLAAETAEAIWWIYAREADGLRLASIIASSIGTAWLTDSEIVFAPAEGGLRLMNLAAANAQTTLLDERLEYRLPTLTRDDRLAFFTRDPADPATPPGFGRLRVLARGAAVVETLGQPIALTGMRWAPGGTLLVGLQGGVLGLFDPATGAGVPFSVNNAVAYAWGPLPVASSEVAGDAAGSGEAAVLAPSPPATATPDAAPAATAEAAAPAPATTAEPGAAPPQADAPSAETAVSALTLTAPLFYLNADPDAAAATGGIAQVWLLAGDGRPAFRFTGASSTISEYTPAPNGRALAYVSGGALWVQRLETRQPFIAAPLAGFIPAQPAFSPAGDRIAYVQTGTEANGVWLAALDASAPVRVLAAEPGESFTRPRWSPDGTRLLLDRVGEADAAPTAVILDVNSPAAPLTLGTPADAWRPDGRVLTIADAARAGTRPPGLYSAEPGTGGGPAEWIPLESDMRVLAVRALENGVVRALIETDEGGQRVVDWTGVTAQPVAMLPLPLTSAAFSPDGRFLVGLGPAVSAETGDARGIIVHDLVRGGVFTLAGAEQALQPRWAG
jgi:dipeptidyl aminopeptidase/acylaminoacyl peptidase